jgi:predicted phosphodiesterase
MPRPVRLVLRIALCVVLGVAGAAVATAARGPTEGPTALGTASADLRPVLGPGAVDAYVPIVDWGLRSRSYAAPVRLDLEVRALDRESVVGALRSGDGAERELRRVESDLRGIVRREVWGSAVWAVVGGLVGGLLAGALLAAFGRRRWLALGAATGLASAGALTIAGLLAVSGLGRDAFSEPVFYARGGELPELLAFSEQLSETTGRYADSYERALAGLETLIGLTRGPGGASPIAQTVLVASDLHSNSLVLPALADYASGKTVFVVGDFAQLGTRYEEWVVYPVSQLGDRVVAVSGNHDSDSLMEALAGAGVTVLTRTGRLAPDGTTDGEPVVDIDGMLVAGYDDPLQGTGDIGAHDLEIRGAPMRLEEEAFVDWFRSLPERPAVVLVHQHGLAHALLQSLAPDEPPLIVLTGHDHVAHVEQSGPHVLLDGGSVGAGGPFAIGQEPAAFAQLHLEEDGMPAAVDLVEIEPISGAGSARRIPLELPGDGGGETVRLDAADEPDA